MVGLPFLLYGLLFIRLMFSGRLASTERGLAGQAAGGRMGPAGLVLVLLAAGYLLVLLVTLISDFADFFSEIMPQTPTFVFKAALLLLTTFSLLQGIESLGRVALIMLPLVLAFILGGMFGNIPSLEPQNLLPLLEEGPLPLARAVFLQAAYTNELFALGFLTAYAGYNIREVRRASYLGFLTVAGLFFLVSLFLIGVLGESYATRANFKLFSLFHYGFMNSATGYESMFIAVWVTIFFVKAAILQGAIGTALNQAVPLKPGLYYIAAGVAAFLAALFAFESRMELLRFYSDLYPPVSIAFTALFLILIYFFSGKDKGK